MKPTEFIEACLKTEKRDFAPVKERLQNENLVKLLHSAIGICTEAGEFQDMLKKHIFYGKEIDYTNLKEELGDLMWYIGTACKNLDITLEEVMQANADKLAARYAGGFSEKQALNRNLNVEREILEK